MNRTSYLKISSLFLILVFCIPLLLFVGCDDNCSVKFRSNGGTTYAKVIVEKGNSFSDEGVNLPTPVKTGCRFLGWYTTEDFKESSKFSTTTEITKDVILYAKWSESNGETVVSTPTATYSVLFNSNGGTTLNEVSIEQGKSFADVNKTLQTPSKSNYRFVEWRLNSENGPVFTKDTKVTKDITLYAKWESTTSSSQSSQSTPSSTSRQRVQPTPTIAAPTSDPYLTLSGRYVTGLTTAGKSQTSITIPEGITNITSGAFKNNDKITSLKLSSTMWIIAKEAFYNCSKLTNVDFNNSEVEIGVDAFKFCYALSNCTNTKKVYEISKGAFYYCDKLQNFDFTGVTTIGPDAFYYAGLKQINLPNNVRLYSQAFICCPVSKITIPKNVIYGNDSGYKNDSAIFMNCNFTEVKFEKGSTQIGSSMFYKATIGSLYIPKSLRDIQQLNYASTITNIFYEGSQSEWNNVFKDAVSYSPGGGATVTANPIQRAALHYNSY